MDRFKFGNAKQDSNLTPGEGSGQQARAWCFTTAKDWNSKTKTALERSREPPTEDGP